MYVLDIFLIFLLKFQNYKTIIWREFAYLRHSPVRVTSYPYTVKSFICDDIYIDHWMQPKNILDIMPIDLLLLYYYLVLFI